jgi:hypothetical protein
MQASLAQARFVRTEIERTLTLLEWEPSFCYELRALGNREIGIRHGTVSGYFSDPKKMAQAAADWSGKVEGVYMVLNPVLTRLLWRSANRVRHFARHTTKDEEVTRRRRLLVDLDPVRPAGLSATDEEHELALDRATAVRDYLHGKGFSDLVLADSGNGGHVWVPFDRPNDAEANGRAERFLRGLAEQFSDEAVVVDQTTHNASRLCKLYGTMSCKGDPSPENPHRLSRILEIR